MHAGMKLSAELDAARADIAAARDLTHGAPPATPSRARSTSDPHRGFPLPTYRRLISIASTNFKPVFAASTPSSRASAESLRRIVRRCREGGGDGDARRRGAIRARDARRARR